LTAQATLESQTANPAAAGPQCSNLLDQAIIALREGKPVIIQGAEADTLVYAAETAFNVPLALMKNGVLLLTTARARTLGINTDSTSTVAFALRSVSAPECIRSLIDPTANRTLSLGSRLEPSSGASSDHFELAVKLAKLAGLLPAALALSLHKTRRAGLRVPADLVRNFDRQAVKTLSIVARARVPLEVAESAEVVAFRSRDGGQEHYAILIGNPASDRAPLARLHSQCLTGDLLGSLRCDCGPQLRGAIELIAKAGSGVLLYLAQEGRGIGLANKLRAYCLQDRGLDTWQANQELGFEPDERLHEIAARMLLLLGIRSVRLLTNNPVKTSALERGGVVVVERVPHRYAATAHNVEYLEAKAAVGHEFE
jgi:GTP cyclohydrolase II